MIPEIRYHSNRFGTRNIVIFPAFICALLIFSGCTKNEDKPKEGPLIILGLDGIDWAIVDTLFEQGRLPQMKKLVDHGVRADLETIEPMLSPVIWTTVVTGKPPEKHGITHFVQKDPKTGRHVPVSSLKRRGKALWNILSELGHTVGFIGFWASWPAEKVKGVIVSDHLTYHGFGVSSDAIETSEGDIYPQSMAPRVRDLVVQPNDISDAEILDYMKITDAELRTRPTDSLDFSNPLHHFVFSLATNRTYENIALWMLEEVRPEVLGVYMEMPDSMSHLFMKYTPPHMAGLDKTEAAKFEQVVYKAYERQDKVIGRLIDKAGPNASFVILSDHGFKTGDSRLTESVHTDLNKAHLWHEKYGVLILSGPRFAKAKKLKKASVYDIAPTVLHALGEKAALDMPGNVLTEAFSKAYQSNSSPIRIGSYDPNLAANHVGEKEARTTSTAVSNRVDEVTLERLAALGYVDRLGNRENDIATIRGLLRSRDMDTAKRNLSTLLEQYPDDAEIHVLAGDMYTSISGVKKESRSLEYYLRSVDLACGSEKTQVIPCGNVLVHVSGMFLEFGAIEQASELIKKLEPYKQHQTSTQYMRGRLLEKQGDLKGATGAYERALSHNPAHISSLNNAAGCLAETGQTKDAIAYYLRAAALDPAHVNSRFNLGVLAMSQKRYQEAAGYFRSARAIRPGFAGVYPQLIRAEIAAGQIQRASMHLTQYGQVEKNRSNILILEADIYDAKGDKENATRLRNEATKLDSKQ